MINHLLKTQVSACHLDFVFNALQPKYKKGCPINGMVFFYAFNKETTFLISIKSSENMKIMESIFKRSSKVPISFYYISGFMKKEIPNSEIF